ncbi:MAG: ankyrin repeat domain-containing protein [Planctomycetota bacterium]
MVFATLLADPLLAQQNKPADEHNAVASTPEAQPASLEERSILRAARQNDWLSVRRLLKEESTADVSDADGTSLVHWAVFHQQSNELRWLIERGAKVDQPNQYQVTPLSLACEYGHEQCAKTLIEQQADIETTRLGGERPLMLAARSQSLPIVQALIAAKVKLDAREKNGQTALMWAAAAGHATIVDALLDAGADRDIATKKSGFNAFLFAAREGKSAVIQRMIDAGCDVNQTLKPIRTGGRNPRKNMSALMLAVESGHLDLALKLVDQGADPNDQRSGFSPLHAITWVRKTKLGDNPEGDPPPRIDGKSGTLAFVREIVQRGADVNLVLKTGRSPGKAQLNNRGATPFMLAAKTADLPLLKLLAELGADATVNNADGCTPLMACAGIGAVAVGEEPGTEDEVIATIRWLMEANIDINTVDANGETAMHGAAYRNYPRVVSLLASLGADPAIWNKKNRFGWTPFDIASGKRPGSLKPSPATAAALDQAKETFQSK